MLLAVDVILIKLENRNKPNSFTQEELNITYVQNSIIISEKQTSRNVMLVLFFFFF